jgi:short-subunit dehydrogenase
VKGRALVSGASSGIGEAWARRLARDGFDLVLVARRAARLGSLAEQLARAHGVRVELLPADLATDAGVAAVERAIASGPPLAALVCAAGFGTRGKFAELSPEKVTRMVRLHVEANARLVRAALPGMTGSGYGEVILVSSLSAFATTSEYVTYSATKACLNMLALGLRDEVRGTGVRVLAICPGLTKTEFLDTDEFKGFKYDAVPAWAWMTADEVVDESLRALPHSERRPIFIPGRANRMFVAVLETPVLGAVVRAALGRLGRGRNLF